LDTGIETFPENAAIEKLRTLAPSPLRAAFFLEILRRTSPFGLFCNSRAEVV
jgi:hypothetical protein